MRVALQRHDAIMRAVIVQHEGYVFKTVGDSFYAAFVTSPQALSAALAAQHALLSESWPEPVTLRVRMALHTGVAEQRDNDYFGPPLNRTARLLGVGHGGQVLVSHTAYGLVRDALPLSVELRNLGEHRLRDLGQREPIYQLLHPDLPSQFPALRSLSSPDLPNNLPQQVTSFIGREKEMAEVKALLRQTPLLTLTGSGGAGKTRLSLQVAADLLEEYPDGVWLVELAPLTDLALVPRAVVTVLGIAEQAGETFTRTLVEHLKAKKLLLLFDNCEHLLAACAHLADTLLRACPEVKILASSREALGIAGETVYRIPSLSFPDLTQPVTETNLAGFEAIRLFADRALAVLPDFAVTPQNAPSLVSVCRRLDGIPLAIELAAARVRSLSVKEIDSRLDNRFRLLTGGSRTALPRQQTLRALIDWSYDLLTETERLLLARLAVFAGGWTPRSGGSDGGRGDDRSVGDSGSADESGGQVAGAGRDGRGANPLSAPGDHAAVCAGAAWTEQKRGGRYMPAIGTTSFSGREEVRPKLSGPEQGHWLEALEAEHDNLRQALRFCREEPGEAQAGLRLGRGAATVLVDARASPRRERTFECVVSADGGRGAYRCARQRPQWPGRAGLETGRLSGSAGLPIPIV